MPNQGSKMVPEDEVPAAESAAESTTDKGKQAAVADASNDAPAAESSTAAGDVNPNRGKAETAMGKALSKLTPQQVQELLSRNPTLQQEVASSIAASGSGEGVVPDSKEAQELARKKLIELFKSMSMGDLMTGMAAGKNAKDMASYKFWKTQPVPSFDDDPEADLPDGPLENKTIEDVPKEPADLAQPGFEWCTMDITDPGEMKEVYTLLNGHYVEDASAQFRFDYSEELLQWALMAPGWRKDWNVGIRTTESRKLVAFISAIPFKLRVRENIVQTGEVNFLCVHKKLRNKRLAPILIKEVTRRINLEGIWQGLYTGGTLLPRPVTTTRYFHRPIRWQRLFELGFSAVPNDSKPAFQVRKFQLPQNTSIRGFREMKASDAPQAKALLDRYLQRWDFVPVWSDEEFDHWMVNKVKDQKKRVVFAYVVEGPDKKITDFISFYRLESTALQKKTNLHACYLFYYATEVGLVEDVKREDLRARLTALTNDVLVVAEKAGFDVMNALTLMENSLFLDKCKFRPGDGALHYYLFNYRVKPIPGGIKKTMALDDEKLSGLGLMML